MKQIEKHSKSIIVISKGEDLTPSPAILHKCGFQKSLEEYCKKKIAKSYKKNIVKLSSVYSVADTLSYYAYAAFAKSIS